MGSTRPAPFVLVLLLSVIFAAVTGGRAHACSCFAVYGDEPVYGMNFDYTDTEVKLRIRPSLGLRVFEMQFEKDGRFLETVGMNSEGLFISSQLLYPEVPGKTQPGPDELFTWQVYTEALPRITTVGDVLDFIGERRIVHGTVSLHQFVADSSGAAMVVEAGPGGNRITLLEKDFLIMTNFPVCDFHGRDYRETTGVGADRYQILHERISRDHGDFTVERAMAALAAASSAGHWATRCSMVFLPRRGEIFVAFDRDYDRIWTVSLEEKTIRTWAGAEDPRVWDIGYLGISASSLQRGELPAIPWYVWLALGLLLLLVVVSTIVIIRTGRRKSRRPC